MTSALPFDSLPLVDRLKHVPVGMRLSDKAPVYICEGPVQPEGHGALKVKILGLLQQGFDNDEVIRTVGYGHRKFVYKLRKSLTKEVEL